MNALEKQLEEYMVNQGDSPATADAAARKCIEAVARNTSLGFGIGVGVGLITSNPGALLMGVAAGSIAGAATFLADPSCEAVREAAMKVSRF